MSVRVRDMVIASVACKGVFKRFAQLSEEEQADVVSRVKKKLNGDGNGDEQVVDTEAASDTVLDTDGESNGTDDAAEGDDDVGNEELTDEDIAAIDEIAGGGGEEGGEELSDDDISAIDDIAGGDAESGGDEMMGIVDGLAAEVEQIKSDGKVDTSEVLGLFDNMMQMVTLLVNTKAPTKPKETPA